MKGFWEKFRQGAGSAIYALGPLALLLASGGPVTWARYPWIAIGLVAGEALWAAAAVARRRRR